MRALIYTATASRSRARRAARCLGFTVDASLGLTSPPNNRRRKEEKRSAQANTAQQDNAPTTSHLIMSGRRCYPLLQPFFCL